MIMRTVRTALFAYLLFFSTVPVFAQENSENLVLKKDFEIQKHTIMERFEPGYVVSAQERTDMKRKRIANEEYTLSVLDTIKISNRKRKQLLRDLKFNPFSDRLSKFVVDTKFDDEDMVHQQK